MSPEDVFFQAQAFLDWSSRCRGSFDRWAASKDFHPTDRARIRAEVQRQQARTA